jgi:hypothetical protein
MEHSDKVRHLEEARRQGRQGGMVIYPVASQQGCAMALSEFAEFAQAAEDSSDLDVVLSPQSRR